MRRYWATLVGAALGMLGGLYGALFGGAIGVLLDLVLNEYRASGKTERYLHGRTPEPWLPMLAILTGVLAGRFPPVIDARQIRHLAQETIEPRAFTIPRRVLERVIVTAATTEWDRDESFETAFVRGLDQAARQRVIRLVWRVLVARGSAEADRSQMLDFARRVLQDTEFVNRTIVVERKLDEEACSLLGISRDAAREEVQRAYRKLASQFHPDTAIHLSEEQRAASEAAFKRITAAYEQVLSQLE